jgi:hypothetical protein
MDFLFVITFILARNIAENRAETGCSSSLIGKTDLVSANSSAQQVTEIKRVEHQTDCSSLSSAKA